MEYKYIKEALSHYNIPESEVVLLRHNENMTFRVGTDYLLQIHELVEGFFVLSILGSIVIHYEQWSRQDWFEDRMKRWCKESFVPFCSGERLFADDLTNISEKG